MCAPLHARAQADDVSVLWLLPDGLLPQCRAFWQHYRELVPTAPEARELSRPPGTAAAPTDGADNANEPPLAARQLGLLPLQALTSDGPAAGASRAPPAAQLVLLTATSIDVGTCLALGEHLLSPAADVRFVGVSRARERETREREKERESKRVGEERAGACSSYHAPATRVCTPLHAARSSSVGCPQAAARPSRPSAPRCESAGCCCAPSATPT
eukprot:1722779-Prymnesium_polylepis.2